MTRTRMIAMGAGIAALSLALAACGGASSSTSVGLSGCKGSAENTCNTAATKSGGEVKSLISLPFEAWSTITALGNSIYTRQAVDPVLPNTSDYSPDGTWTWDKDFFAEVPKLVSESPQTIEFTISDKAKWSDGVPITATDFKFLWYYASDPADGLCKGCEPADTTDLGLVKSITSDASGKKVTITLKDGAKNPEWQPAYGGLTPHPAHLATKAGFDWEHDPAAVANAGKFFSETTPTVSGGPYKVSEAKLGERVTYVPNDTFYGPKPKLAKIDAEVVADPATWVQAITNKDLTVGSPGTFDVTVWNELPTVPGLTYSAGSKGAVWEHIDLNEANPFLKDKALRQAILTAIDAKDLEKRIWGAADGVKVTPRTNVTFSETSDYHKNVRDASGQGGGDIAAARKILTDAGYTGAEKGGTLTTPDGKPVKLNFRWTAGNTNRAKIAELAQSYLADLGIKLELKDADDLGTMLSTSDYDIVIFGWSGSPRFVSSLGQFWTSKSESNYNHINNPEIDKLAKEAQAQTDLDASAKVANQVAQLVTDEAVILPLWDTPQFDFAYDDMANVRPNRNSPIGSTYDIDDWGFRAE